MLFEDRRAAPALGARIMRSYVPLRCGPSENGSENNICLPADAFPPRDYELSARIAENFFQCIFAARMASYHTGITSPCLFYRAFHHLMGHSIREQHDQIRTSDLLT